MPGLRPHPDDDGRLTVRARALLPHRVQRVAAVLTTAALMALWVALGTSLYLSLLVAGITLGAIYALSGLGLLITYRASGVFNFGHGAIAMFTAYVLWQLVVGWGVPLVPAALVALLVVGPGLGLALERFVFRPLAKREAGTAEQLVATVGVFILLVGLAMAIWGPETKTDPPSLFGTSSLRLGGATVGIDQLAIIATVGAVAVAIWWLFERTTIGLRIRAVVEHRDLAQLSAVDAERVSGLAWAIGAGMAGLTGVLLAPSTFGLNPFHLTLLVAETFAVAVIARLSSLSLAVAGGVGLGLAMSFATQLRADELLRSVGVAAAVAESTAQWVRPLLASLPVVALFLALLVHRRFAGGSRAGSLREIRLPDLPLATRAARHAWNLGIAGLLVAAPLVVDGALLRSMQDLVALAVVFLSIVVITGYGGHISLAQAAFAGLGAFLTGRLVAGSVLGVPAMPVLLAMTVAAVVCMVLGTLVALPALRRHRLLLALTTFATALVLERFVFANHQLTAGAGTLRIRRPSLLGLDLSGDVAFYYLELVVLAVALGVLLALRVGRLGRSLRAMRDSARAARAIGISPRRTTLLVFVVGAGIAGVGGSLLTQTAQTFSPEAYRTLDSLIWFAAVVVAGTTSVHGALLAAFALTVLSRATGELGVVQLAIGIGALSIGRLPGGIVGVVSRWVVQPATRERPARDLVPSTRARELLGRAVP